MDMTKRVKNGLVLLSMGAAWLFAACAAHTAPTSDVGQQTTGDDIASDSAFVVSTGTTSEGLKEYVATKYANGMSDAAKSQTSWNAVNCHDPKIFQDDDGTYYVYTTDASCGNIGRVGIHVRHSTDLVNWTGESNSALAGYWDEAYIAWEDFTASSSQVRQNNSDYTAYTWAPTVYKQNGLYYMYHGVNADVGTSSNRTRAASSITLAIASAATGPFYPASFISNYEAGSDSKNDSDIRAIQAKLRELGVTYSQNFLVRYAATGSSITQNHTPTLDGEAVAEPEYGKSNNSRFGCIDPEFVYDVATGELVTKTIGSNTCYPMIYGSWMYGIALIYVDAVSFKPVATEAFTDGSGNSIAVGDELDMPLDEANLYAYPSNSNAYGLVGTRIAGGYGAGYEGAQLFYNSDTGFYYLITSCGGLDYEYRCTMSRSSAITGTYYDAGGQSMLLSSYSGYHAIGSKIIGSCALENEYSFRCQGGLSIIRNDKGQIIFACHTRTNFQMGYYFYLQCHQLFFNEDGWPVLNQNEYYDDYTDITQDGLESLVALTLADLAGTYDTILTVRGTDTAAVSSLGIYGADSVSSTVNKQDAVPTASKTMVIAADGSISGGYYTGSVSLAADGYSATIVLKSADGSALGTFKGCFLNAVDWARKGTKVTRRTLTFTTLCSESSASEAGEYFWGNRNESASSWTASADGNSITYSGEDTAAVTIPALSVTASEGFTVQFTLNDTLANHSNSDWVTQLLSYKGCHVTIPNLDPWNNTVSGSTLTGKNAFPTLNSYTVLSSGYAYNFPWGSECTIKITLSSSAIKWYKNGNLALTYNAGLWGSSSDLAEFVGYYVTGLAAAQVVFNAGGMNISNLTVSKGIN